MRVLALMLLKDGLHEKRLSRANIVVQLLYAKFPRALLLYTEGRVDCIACSHCELCTNWVCWLLDAAQYCPSVLSLVEGWDLISS